MEIVHVYQRPRSEFGRQANFSDRSAKLVADIQPDPALAASYMVRSPVDMACQETKEYSEHEVNTETAEYTNSGMNHVEGGWPKDVDPNEVEQTQRFRKKEEKKENFVSAVKDLGGVMEHAIKQNNAVDIYEDYFLGEESGVDSVEAPSAKVTAVFRDPQELKRSVNWLSWYPDQATRVAGAYSILDFQKAPEGMSADSYIWNIERSAAPETTLSPSSPLVSIEYNPKDLHMLLGGQYNGQVAIFDPRKGSRPVEVSPIEKSHRDPVFAAKFLASKQGTDAFSCSSDGQVLFWDVRKLAEPMETLMIDPLQNGKLLGGVALEYEPTMPTKFQVGTEQGEVVLFNRKGKTPAEKISATYPCHLGPVYTCERNPFFPKYFLTVGDWSMRTWCEDIKESSVMWTKFYDCNLTSGAWSTSRPSVCFSTKADGSLDIWDILFKSSVPTLTVQVTDISIQSIRVDSSGKYVCVGDKGGTISLVELNDALSKMQNSEKPNVSAFLDRETNREKSVVARIRELKLKEAAERKKSASKEARGSAKPKEGEGDAEEEDPIAEAEKAFWEQIEADKLKRERDAAKKAKAAEAAAQKNAESAATEGAAPEEGEVAEAPAEAEAAPAPEGEAAPAPAEDAPKEE
eukprot:CAMPEP_0182915526 /NCGR_PEP_ID=MMETSP0105_2-20130417/374_1 /TAXON_ID=81532 ORGANISM="Acanthoeca-like sp., Strain 10tr" /NCGR_SAMPLE_ID=MMETSP0105_2 /ASSEMBLY_ACC=CAM_ASM_000205 /LENGTH=630 /DNA_ID=CAMNT_0025052397 /DNA_START=32 /DNA_END=1924 /DNA_ORIENTATION=+